MDWNHYRGLFPYHSLKNQTRESFSKFQEEQLFLRALFWITTPILGQDIYLQQSSDSRYFEPYQQMETLHRTQLHIPHHQI